MSTKIDLSSSSESQRVQSTAVSNSPTVAAQPPKVSKFGTKSGFVIPKNKLSGSLVPIFRSSVKVEGSNTVNEESTKQIHRKTRWGHDVTQDAAVRKGKALAYQTRLEQINQQLKSGALFKDSEGSESPKEAVKNGSSDEPTKDASSKRKLLELERREVIGEILRLNPTYKAPADYKPLQKEGKVPIPIKAHPGYNFLGLFLGPASSTQKRLEEETGAKVRLYGIKKGETEKHEITQISTHDGQDAYEELYVNVSADTYEKVDAAIALIELLLKPLSDNAGVSSTKSVSVTDGSVPLGDQSQALASSFVVMPIVDVNQGIVQPMSVAPLPGPMQYQPYASSWYPSAPVANPLAPSYIQSSVPNNFSRFPSPPISTVQNSTNAFRPHAQAMQHSLNQPALAQNRPGLQLPMASASRPMHSGNVTAHQPSLPASSQPVVVSPYSPIRPLALPVTPPVGSSGWSPVPQLGPPNQRPHVSPLSGQLMRPNLALSLPPTTNMPLNALGRPPTVIMSQQLPPNGSSTIASGQSAINFSRPPLPGQQSELHTFLSGHPQTDKPFASSPMHLQMLTSVPRPLPVLGPNPGPLVQSPALVSATMIVSSSFSVATVEKPLLPFSPSVPVGAPRLAQPPTVAPGSTQSFFPAIPGATTASSSGQSHAAPRPLGPISGDFTFQPLRGSVPAPSSQIVQQTTLPLRAPQPPSFRPTVQAPAPSVNAQGFARPLVANTNPSQAPVQMPPSSVPFSVRPTMIQTQPSFSDPRSLHLAASNQLRPASYSSVSQVLNLPGSLSLQHANVVHPRQNQLPTAVRPGNHIKGPGKVLPNPGGNQIYDPFSPTSFSSASRVHSDDPVKGRKPETDSEYEDLMASVGVK